MPQLQQHALGKSQKKVILSSVFIFLFTFFTLAFAAPSSTSYPATDKTAVTATVPQVVATTPVLAQNEQDAVTPASQPTTTNTNTTDDTPTQPASSTLTFSSLSTLLTNLLQSTIDLQVLVQVLAYVIGIALVIKALLEFKRVSESSRMMGGQQHGMRGPIIMLTIGVACLFFPTTMDVGLSTLFGSSSILPYQSPQNPLGNQALNVLVKIIQLVGFISFLRGLLLFHKSATGQGEQKAMARGFNHIIGGILCMNIVATTNLIYSTLGILSN